MSCAGNSTSQGGDALSQDAPDVDVEDDYVNPIRLARQERTTPRFGEPAPDMENDFPAVFHGEYAKLGSAPAGIVCESGKIIMVDTIAFDGTSHFPVDMTKDWRQGGDLLCTAQCWKDGATQVLGRRQSNSDSRNQFSMPLEWFQVTKCCLPENHVLYCSYNNCTCGYFQTNPELGDPEIQMWRSLRRGIPLDASSERSDYQQYISELPGPIGVLDCVSSTADLLAEHLSAAQVAAIRELPVDHQTFEQLVVLGKPDRTMSQGLLICVTNWKRVWGLRSVSLADYNRALKANLVHRKMFEFERMCFEMRAVVSDIESASDLVNASQIRKDVVSPLCIQHNYMFNFTVKMQLALLDGAPDLEGGEKTTRYNLKPALRRWSGSIFGDEVHKKTSSQAGDNDGDHKSDADFVLPPPKPKRTRRSGTDSNTDSSVILISDGDTPGKKVAASKRGSLKQSRDAIAHKLDLGNQKARVRTLESANQRLTKKLATLEAERAAEKEVLTLLKEKQREHGKAMKIDESGLRQLISGYHTSVMAELAAIRSEVLAVKNTPLEITATTTPTRGQSGFGRTDNNNNFTDFNRHGGETPPLRIQPPAHVPTPRGSQGSDTSYGGFDNGSRQRPPIPYDGRSSQHLPPQAWPDMRNWRDDNDHHRQFDKWDRDHNATPPFDVHRHSEHPNTWKSDFYSGLGNQYAPTVNRNLSEYYPDGPPLPTQPTSTTFVIAKASHKAPPVNEATPRDDDSDSPGVVPKPKRKLSKRR